MVQMGSGTLSTRLRATRPSFCLVTIDREHITLGPQRLDVHRNYDSRTHQPEMLFQHPASHISGG
jgi:hypothetical protein